jgi:hypothetical protein
MPLPVGGHRAAKILLLTAIITIAGTQAAYAYIDPNSAGVLYQILFPMFIAIASTLAALRGMIRRLWNRGVNAVVASFRGERFNSKGKEP